MVYILLYVVYDTSNTHTSFLTSACYNFKPIFVFMFKVGFLSVSYSWILLFCFLNQSENLCLLVGTFRLFTFNVTINMVRFQTIYYLAALFFYLFFVPLFLFLPSSGMNWFFKFSFYFFTQLISYHPLLCYYSGCLRFYNVYI